MGELAYESGRLSEARLHFARAASSRNTADDVVVWARTYGALLDALAGKPEASRPILQANINPAREMGRVVLETTTRVFLARASLLSRRGQEARRAVEDLPAIGEQGLGLELRALVHYWRGKALVAGNDASGGHSEIARARELLARMRESIPETYRASFDRRPDIRALAE
jgi:hypothetical protein